MVDYRIFDRDKFTVVGSPTISNDGIASGFSTSDYLSGINIDCTTLNKLEINCSFTTGSSVSTNYINIWNIGNSSGFFFGYFGSKVGLQYKGSGLGDFFVSPDTSYDTKVVWERNIGITIYYKEKSETEYSSTPLDTVINTLTINTNSIIKIAFGTYLQPFNGSIDLKQFLIEVDGVEVFSGSHLANTAEKLQYLKDSKEIIRQSIEAKGVEVPVETPFRQYADKIEEIKTGGDPVIKGYRMFEAPYGPCKVENNILIVDQNNTNILQESYSTNVNNDILTAVARVKLTGVKESNLNILFGSVNNSFCVGCGANTTKLGVWLYNSGGSRLNGDNSTGQSDFELELDKWYYIRFRYYFDGYRSHGAFAYLDIKENLEDEFINIFTSAKLAGYSLGSVPSTMYYGGASYGGNFTGLCNIDMTSVYMIYAPVNPNRSFQIPFS